MRNQEYLINRIDWLTIVVFFSLVIMGWLNIYASVYEEDVTVGIFNLSLNSGKQLVFIGSSLILITVILAIDFRFYESFSFPIYGLFLILLVAVLFLGKEVSGARSWFDFGAIRFQPSEFAKIGTALVVAKFMGNREVSFGRLKDLIPLILLVLSPMVLILLQPDAGTAMIFGSFIIVFYREGLSPFIIMIGITAVVIFLLTLLVPHVYLFSGIIILVTLLIAFGVKSLKRIVLIIVSAGVIVLAILSVDFVLNNVLKPHQQNRIVVLLNPDVDPLGAGWNVTQSKIAIGSGGIFGKGFLAGTQTKFDFVPEQSTDFIFCTIGEEHGWIGSIILLSLFMFLFVRVINIAERQKSKFARVYGYSVISILFFHFMVNIGMTVGLFPAVGIPLPFFSYGGSALWSFTILLFILLKLDADRMQLLER